jgi:hypothetical protein
MKMTHKPDGTFVSHLTEDMKEEFRDMIRREVDFNVGMGTIMAKYACSYPTAYKWLNLAAKEVGRPR